LFSITCARHMTTWNINKKLRQEAQLSQRGRATLHVVGNFVKLLKIAQGHSKLHR